MRDLERLGALSLAVTLLATSGACAGARFDVRADGARYPISLSPVLPDGQRRPAYLGHELRDLGTFVVETTKYSIFYGQVGGTLDVSEIVNREVEARHGRGVVGLSITAENCGLNWMFPLTVLPIWPGCQDVTIRGTVVDVATARVQK